MEFQNTENVQRRYKPVWRVNWTTEGIGWATPMFCRGIGWATPLNCRGHIGWWIFWMELYTYGKDVSLVRFKFKTQINLYLLCKITFVIIYYKSNFALSVVPILISTEAWGEEQINGFEMFPEYGALDPPAGHSNFTGPSINITIYLNFYSSARLSFSSVLRTKQSFICASTHVLHHEHHQVPLIKQLTWLFHQSSFLFPFPYPLSRSSSTCFFVSPFQSLVQQ